MTSPAPRSARVTAADVARASGVSRATVSYVLNDTPGQTIPDSTRQRIRQAAAELGYVPSVHARALASGSTGIVVIDASTIPPGELVAAATRALSRALVESGYVPVVNQYTGADAGGDVLVALARRLQPAVVVALGGLAEPLVARLREAGAGRVVVPRSDDDPAAHGVRDLAAAQVAYLAERGHRAVLYVGPPEPELAEMSAIRHEGARESAAAHGIALEAVGFAEQEELAEELRHARARGVTAVAAYNDEVAVGVLGAAQRLRLDVPGDLAVIGIDDLPIARRTHPQLTTVSQSDGSMPLLGAAEIRAVLDGARPILPRVTPKIVRRGSA